MQFQQDWPKDKKYSSLNFLQEILEKFGSRDLYDAPLEGSKVRATRANHGYHSCVCLSVCLSVCLPVCVCVCLSVCGKAKCVDVSARIATKLHTRTKNLPGKVLKPISIS